MTIISLFHCSPQIIRDTPGLGDDLRAAGVIHLDVNAADVHELPWCKGEGWRVVLIGDGIMRTREDRDKYCTEAKVIDIATQTRESGICDGLELVDEMKQDPAYYERIPDFMRWWKYAGGPPVAFPGFETSRYHQWADYFSCQWKHDAAHNYKTRDAWMTGAINAVPHDGRRIGTVIPVYANQYEKRVEGGTFRNGKDQLRNGGMNTKGIGNLMRKARQLGVEQFHLYALDTFWAQQRLDEPVGSRTLLQTGAGPHVDKRRWKQILAVCKEITQGVNV